MATSFRVRRSRRAVCASRCDAALLIGRVARARTVPYGSVRFGLDCGCEARTMAQKRYKRSTRAVVRADAVTRLFYFSILFYFIVFYSILVVGIVGMGIGFADVMNSRRRAMGDRRSGRYGVAASAHGRASTDERE